MLREASLGALVVVLAAVSLNVSAQAAPASGAGLDAEAKGLFLAGKAAFEEGRYTEALNYFTRSYQLSDRAALLYNIGQAADRLRHDREALDAFEQYLSRVPDAPNRPAVEERIKVLREVLEAQERSEKEKKHAAPAPAAAEAPQGETEKKLETTASVAPPSEPVTPSSVAGESEEFLEQTGDQGKWDERRGILSRWWFWTAVGVVVAGAAIVGIVALTSKSERYQEPLPAGTGVVITTLKGL